MSDDNVKPGTVSWRDLTVEEAEPVAEFYQDVVGWEMQPVAMGNYDDYAMVTADGGEGVAGVCHARGSNAHLPALWLIYISVSDLDASARKCVELGGKILDGPRPSGGGRMCVIKDPAGAVAALHQQ